MSSDCVAPALPAHSHFICILPARTLAYATLTCFHYISFLHIPATLVSTATLAAVLNICISRTLHKHLLHSMLILVSHFHPSTTSTSPTFHVLHRVPPACFQYTSFHNIPGTSASTVTLAAVLNISISKNAFLKHLLYSIFILMVHLHPSSTKVPIIFQQRQRVQQRQRHPETNTLQEHFANTSYIPFAFTYSTYIPPLRKTP